MKFQKTVDVWANGVQEKIKSGELVLQTGQWVVCGAGNRKARYVGLTAGGTIWITHWCGTPEATNKRFMTMVEAFTRVGR